MNVGEKTLLINKDINVVIGDLKQLTRNPKIVEDFNKNYVFYGEINGNCFKYGTDRLLQGGLLYTPEIHGEIFEENNKTIIKMEICTSFFTILCNIFLLALGISYIIKFLTVLSEQNKYYIIFAIVLILFLPIFSFINYSFQLKEIINDFYLYKDGYYD